MIKVKNKLVRDNGLNQRFISIGIIEKAKLVSTVCAGRAVLEVQSNLAIRNGLIRNKLVLRNHLL